MHPFTLLAQAAAAALGRALEALEARAREALRDAEAGNRDGDVPIRSQQFGHRTALGVHGDPTADAAMQALKTPWQPPNPYAVMRADQLRHLDERYGHWPGAPGMDPLLRVQRTIPRLAPADAADVADDLARMDGHARKLLQLPPDLTPVDGLCPACRMRALYRTGVWVVCRATGCVCTGPGCGCGMDEPTPDARHIWTADTFAVHAVSV